MKYGLLLTLVCLTITSCGRSPEDSNSAIMDFKIVDVQMEGVSDTSPKFSFPSQNRKYKIAGTAVDSYTLNPIPHASFIIDYGIEGKVTVQSDASGRLFWNELIRFNLLNEKKRILITRGFSAQTSQASASEVSYSIYPYASYISDDVSEFLIHNEVVPDEFVDKLDAAKWNKRKAELHSKNATLQLKYLKPSNQGGVYRFQLNSEVSVILEKSNGEEFDYDLQNSQFDLQLIIYEGRADRDSAVALYSGYFKDVKVLNGKLDQEFEGTISLRNFTSDIYVGIRLIPTVQADQFSEFHGLYNLGKVGEVQGRHELTFERALNSRHSAYKIPQPYSVQKDGVDNSIKNINFSKLDLEYDLIEDGETPTWRSIIYRSSTCAKDLYNGNELAFEKFKIVKTSGEEIIREADGDGCLFWNERIEHKYYKPESFFTRTNTITHISSNISRHVTSYINPWTILTIGRDEREMDKATLARLASREVVHPRLFLAEYFYETIGVTYYIDQFLTLFVRKNIQLVLEFEVTRYSSLTDGINAKEAIRDGVYLLKVALEKSYIDTRKSQVDIDQTMESVEVRKGETRKPLEYIYIVNKLVRVWNGHIITPIELSIHDLRLMTVRSNFLVQLETIEQNHLNLSKNFDIEEIKTDRVVGKIQQAFPGQEPNLDLLVDHDSGLPTRTFAGPMVLLEIEGGAEVRPTDAMNICETDDCNFLERNNPELRKRIYKHDKKYYGNIHHLANQSVDKLAQRKKILDFKYKNQKTIESLFFNYLDTFKLSLISDITNQRLKVLPIKNNVLRCERSEVDSCLVETKDRQIAPTDFLAELSRFSGKSEEKLELSHFYSPEKIKQHRLYEKVCDFMTRNLGVISKNSSHTDRRSRNVRLSAMRKALNGYCSDPKSYSFNKIIRNKGIHQFHFLGGKTVNFDLGSENTIYFSEAFEKETNLELNPLGFLGAIKSGVGNIIDGMIAYTFSGRSRQEYAYEERSELTSTTYLSMQRATFEMNFRDPILCVEVRPTVNFAKAIVTKLSDNRDLIDYNLAPLVEGYVVCDQSMQSSEVFENYYREHYYYFAQHFTEGHMLDDGSILNHPWLLGLRGVRDYSRFVSLLGVKPSTEKRDMGLFAQFFKYVTSPSIVDEDKLQGAFTTNDIAELPLDQISGAFDNVLPSFPGVYSSGVQKKEYPYD